jgi:hypothetical protein
MANDLIGRHKPHFQASIPTHDSSNDFHHHSKLRPTGLVEAGVSKKCRNGCEATAGQAKSGKGAPVARKMDRETDLSRRRWQIEDGSLGGRLKSRVEGQGMATINQQSAISGGGRH